MSEIPPAPEWAEKSSAGKAQLPKHEGVELKQIFIREYGLCGNETLEEVAAYLDYLKGIAK